MAVNEEKIRQHVRETRQQAKQAHYPRKPVPLHGKVAEPDHEPDKRDRGGHTDSHS
jgi:hypothetical protein